MIDVPPELMCSATKDTDPTRSVDEVAAWKLALPTQSERSQRTQPRGRGRISGHLQVTSLI